MRRGWLLLGWLGLAALHGPGCGGGGGGCKADADCPPGTYCRVTTGECAHDCTFDAECPRGYLCSSRGRCQEGCRESNGGVEICDGEDNDCDGATDNIEPRSCENTNAHGSCAGVEACFGTLLACEGPVPAAEECDGLDSDCDGETDEGLQEVPCELQLGVCAGTVRNCLGAQGWTACDYGSDHEPDAETRCDLLDNDCDGETDEEVVPLPGCEAGALARDGADNNCNGLTDEPGGCMVEIPFYPGTYIDTYENTVFASADCTGTRYGEVWADYPAGWPAGSQPGPDVLYGCSLPGVRPSRGISWYRARRACQAQGKRVCTKAEWAMACTDTAHWDFPYGNTYDPDRCNTFSAGFGDTVEAGFMMECTSQIGAYDMSGNLWEWILDDCSYDASLRGIQGGSYYCGVCDIWGNCETCDLDNPDHAEEIDYQHQCHSPAYRWYCADPVRADVHFGFRCCYDRP